MNISKEKKQPVDLLIESILGLTKLKVASKKRSEMIKESIEQYSKDNCCTALAEKLELTPTEDKNIWIGRKGLEWVLTEYGFQRNVKQTN